MQIEVKDTSKTEKIPVRVVSVLDKLIDRQGDLIDIQAKQAEIFNNLLDNLLDYQQLLKKMMEDLR